MKLRGTHILENGELGRKFYVTGSADEPRISTIYATEKDATNFTNFEAWNIILKFHTIIKFECVV
jgi:hypothetical protein